MGLENHDPILKIVRRDPEYVDLFKKVFEKTGEHITMKEVKQAIAAFERSGQVLKFSSRFDRGELTSKEMSGLALFKNRCASCHSDEPMDNNTPPLFTSFGYANIGIPSNPLLSGNPPDMGLGGFLENDYYSLTPFIDDADYAAQYGKFKIPTLRNVGFTAPYGHNGVFPTLHHVVDFHNTRDVSDWPPPEVASNLDTERVGNLGLSEDEVDDIVAFLMSLSDDYSFTP